MRREQRRDGLALTVGTAALPCLRMLVTGGGRMLLVQGTAPVLVARVQTGHYGIAYALTGAYRSPVAPLRAGAARPVAGWAHEFATALQGSGPLYAGRWVLAGGRRDVRPPPETGWVDWFSGPRPVVPLREPGTAGASRVKAYRKQARDGSLPPVLVWWVSGLDCAVVLDGHDRLAAALAEGVRPQVWELMAVQEAAAGQAAALERHESAERAVAEMAQAAAARQAGTGGVVTGRGSGVSRDGGCGARAGARRRPTPGRAYQSVVVARRCRRLVGGGRSGAGTPGGRQVRPGMRRAG